MVTKYHLYEERAAAYMVDIEGGDHSGKPVDDDDQYVKLEDFKKLKKLFIRMYVCVDTANQISVSEGLITEYDKLVGATNERNI